MENKKIILLASSGYSTNVVYNALDQTLGIHTVIIENKISKKTIINRRIKKLGFIRVAGQLLFQVLIVPILDKLSQKRKAAIKKIYRLTDTLIPSAKIKNVTSVNDNYTKELLQQLNPDLIIINGTRIISKKILTSVPCRFLNTHCGITPRYRGVHGSYWALANNDEANSGVTIHLVDAGIDTGGVLYQAKITTTEKDNFTTYPLLQLAAGVPLLIMASKNALENNLQELLGTKESKLWYHPTIWQYFYNWVVKKVK